MQRLGLQQQAQRSCYSLPLLPCPVTRHNAYCSQTQQSQRRRGSAVHCVADAARPATKPPKGVTEPKLNPEVPPGTFGFVDNAERINSRAAMIGFFALIVLEAILGKGLLETLGIGIGGGLGFEL